MERFLSPQFMASHPVNAEPTTKDPQAPDTMPKKVEVNRTPNDRPIFVRTQDQLREISDGIIVSNGSPQPTEIFAAGPAITAEALR